MTKWIMLCLALLASGSTLADCTTHADMAYQIALERDRGASITLTKLIYPKHLSPLIDLVYIQYRDSPAKLRSVYLSNCLKGYP